ncbi:MAG: hypothetical protein S4CHLAM81_09720 [Chlamydiales bacterium]|nr:hypothetical protein [Chlamydiales bacterium]MCH9635750.1 hypothetical protein [Chlamydiales bacterium]
MTFPSTPINETVLLPPAGSNDQLLDSRVSSAVLDLLVADCGLDASFPWEVRLDRSPSPMGSIPLSNRAESILDNTLLPSELDRGLPDIFSMERSSQSLPTAVPAQLQQPAVPSPLQLPAARFVPSLPSARSVPAQPQFPAACFVPSQSQSPSLYATHSQQLLPGYPHPAVAAGILPCEPQSYPVLPSSSGGYPLFWPPVMFLCPLPVSAIDSGQFQPTPADQIRSARPSSVMRIGKRSNARNVGSYIDLNSAKTFCTFCNHSIPEGTTIQRHFRNMHSQQKEPFRCRECSDLGYSNLRALQRHYMGCHSGVDKKYRCGICKRGLTRMDRMSKHVRDCHPSKALEDWSKIRPRGRPDLFDISTEGAFVVMNLKQKYLAQS